MLLADLWGMMPIFLSANVAAVVQYRTVDSLCLPFCCFATGTEAPDFPVLEIYSVGCSDLDLFVSDYAPDVVMSSLRTCNMNCRGPLREKGRGKLGVGVHRQKVEVTNAEWTKRRTTKRRKTKHRMG
jgi:hypothetical protein